MNTADRYKGMTVEDINSDLNNRRLNYSVLIVNFEHDFNIGTVIRNSNAFLARNVYIYGRKQYDRRGTVGTHHYTNLRFLKTIDEIRELRKEYVLLGIDNVEGAEPIHLMCNTSPVLLVFGQESTGIPKDVLDLCDKIHYIEQYGSVRSLNVGCASAIAMYEMTKARGVIGNPTI